MQRSSQEESFIHYMRGATTALRQYAKGHRRKNRLIHRLRDENRQLKKERDRLLDIAIMQESRYE